ncbi:MAG: nucleotide exchange factor GrpE [Gammaproteobacteria bacterium]|nr:nucleotide exchange factor GrpE [Gammaproteobacteria bacterium]MDH3806281.1 nucleotide exchange factor GrpE [Gammaproteobacteria bacterium]
MNGQPERPEPESEDDNLELQAVDAESPVEGDDRETALAELQAKADENWDRYLRAAAEVENIRKRASRDVEHARRFALENFGRELLAVKDSLEMGLAASESADAQSLLAGSEATLKLLAGTLERFGVTEVDPAGEPFDPELHEAMTMQPSADAEPGSVLTVIQKGYVLNGRLLRPARVIVAAEPPPDTADE